MKKYLLPATLGLALVAGVVGAGIASAHGFGGGFGDGSFAASLAQRFNLNEGDVTSFLQEQQAARMEQMQAQMEARLTERLDSAVSEGTITEQQKDLITAKHEELQTRMEQLRDQDLSPEDRKAQMESIHEEMRAWAEANNIPTPFAGPQAGGDRGGFGHHEGGMMGSWSR